uniref:Uncharacterized protein n=1 Tax=Mimivirus LCMiAC02 TaxID=2506609 RepID=A0A4D5XEV8_9VIRU|nr:MAG: hypothetical protein LCMiAC02_03330 [Mimivirus LCMiAC02]
MSKRHLINIGPITTSENLFKDLQEEHDATHPDKQKQEDRDATQPQEPEDLFDCYWCCSRVSNNDWFEIDPAKKSN